MRLLPFILFFVFPLIMDGQSNLLPVAKNGKWGLIDTNGNSILSNSYEHLAYFPLAQKFIYIQNAHKGIINQKGIVYAPPIFEDVILFDSTWWATKKENKWGLSEEKNTHFNHQYDSIRSIAPSVFLLYSGKQAQLYQGNLKERSIQYFNSAFAFNKSYIITQNEDQSYHLFRQGIINPIAEKIDTMIDIGFNYATIIKNGKHQLVDLKTGIIKGREVNELHYQFGHYFLCQDLDRQFFYDAKKDQYYPVPDMDYVNDYTSTNLKFSKNGMQGVWNVKKQTMLIPLTYEAIKKVDEGYFIQHYNRFGLIGHSGKTIVPVEYESLDIHDDVFVVTKNGKQGILSKNGTSIAALDFSKVSVFDSNIKCYTSRDITIISLDKNGNVKSRKTFTDYMTISIEKERLPNRRSSTFNFGGRDEVDQEGSYGWFRPVLTRMVEDSLLEYRGKWGIKDTADSVIVQPGYASIRTNEKIGITKAYQHKLYNVTTTLSKDAARKGWALRYSKSTVAVYQPPFHLYENASRERIGKKQFLSLRLNDYRKFYYARGFDGAPIIVSPDGKSDRKNLRFYGNYSEDILRICEDGNVVLSADKGALTICTVTDFMQRTGSVQEKTTTTEKFMTVENGSWYYLDKTGKQLNETPFQFAEEFKHGCAIVKQGGKWGVIDTAMQIIVPISYEKVERKIVTGHSYFEVSNRAENNYIYTKKNGEIKQTPIQKLSNYHDGHWFAQQKGQSKWALLDTSLAMISNYEYDRVWAFQNDYAMVMKKGKKTLIDKNGNAILSYYKCKKIESIGNDRFSVITSRGTMVINAAGDTLLPASSCKNVLESTSHYLIYEMHGKQIHVLNMTNENTLPKDSRLLSYSLSDDLFLIRKNGKNHLFSLALGKYKQKNLKGIQAIGESTMVYRGENGNYGYLNFEGDTLCPPLFKELNPLKNGWAYARFEKERGPVNMTGNFLFKDPVYRVTPIGDDYTFTTHSGMGIMNKNGEQLIAPAYLKITLYHSIFYKAVFPNGTCDLFTLEGKKINQYSYRNIRAVIPETLIVSHKGFDYLYNGFLNRSLSFQSIVPISSQHYLLRERHHKGLYDAQGNLIIPVRYHKIEATSHYVQVGFFNSFGYFNLNGTPLADPYTGK